MHVFTTRSRLIAIIACLLLVLPAAILLRRKPSTIERMYRATTTVSKRQIDGRLTGILYAPFSAPHVTSMTATSVQLRIEAKHVLDSRDSDLTPAHKGTAAVLVGDFDRAIAILRDATTKAPTDAAAWNDLAVAYIAAARRRSEPHLLIDALAAVSHASRGNPRSVEASFNRGVILEQLGLARAAIGAYSESLALDAESGWATEARVRSAGLRRKPRALVWEQRAAALDQAIASNDSRLVRQIVREFPQESRTYGEAVVLSRWGIAPTAESSDLRIALGIGTALEELTGESLLAHAAAVARNSDGQTRIRLAEAHRTYMQAGTLYSQRKIEQALALFRQADVGFSAGASPMSFMTRYYIASALQDLDDLPAAMQMLDDINHTAPPRFHALHAQIQWEIGRANFRSGRIYEAITAYTSALTTFEQLGEENSANTMRSSIAALEALLGHRASAWRLRLAALHRISDTGDRLNLQRALDAAARTEAIDQRWENAQALFTLATDPELRVNPRIYESSLAWRALAAHRLRMENAAIGDITTARAVVNRLSPGSFRDRAQAELVLVEATVTREKNPGAALALLDKYIFASRQRGNVLFLPEALLERSRAEKALGRRNLAERDLREAIEIMGSRAGAAEGLRDSYFQTGDIAIRELVALLEPHSVTDAFEALESSRSAPYAHTRHTTRSKARLQPGTVVIEYLLEDEALVAFVDDGRQVRSVRKAISKSELSDLCDSFVAELRNDRDANTGAQLGDVLLGSLLDDLAPQRIVFVPDDVLHNVPFAALPSRNRTRLVELCEVVVAPSAAFARTRPGRPPAGPRLVAVGNPSFDRKRFALPDLPGADLEAERVGRMYHDVKVLRGAGATTANVLHELRTADILHVAAHAIAINSDPSRSHLVLASTDGDSGALYLHEIERIENRLQLVVLAGCETALTPSGRRNVATLSNAFLATGVQNVVGSLWSLDDNSAPGVAQLFHNELLASQSPASALRKVQLALLYAKDPAFRRTSIWAALQLYGSGSWR